MQWWPTYGDPPRSKSQRSNRPKGPRRISGECFRAMTISLRGNWLSNFEGSVNDLRADQSTFLRSTGVVVNTKRMQTCCKTWEHVNTWKTLMGGRLLVRGGGGCMIAGECGAKALSSKMSLGGPSGCFATFNANWCIWLLFGLCEVEKCILENSGKHALDHFLDLSESELHFQESVKEIMLVENSMKWANET